MKKTLLVLGFILSLISYGQEFRTTPELSAVFTDSEIKDINTLVNYFENTIQVEGREIEECYKDWFWSVQNGFFDSVYDLDIFTFENQIQIYDEISKETFNNIWTFGSTYSKELDGEVKIIGANSEGKYIQFLEKVGNERDEVKDYVENVKWVFEYGMISAFPVFMERNELNKSWEYRNGFHDFNDKIILTIMTLTSVDEYGRKELFKIN